MKMIRSPILVIIPTMAVLLCLLSPDKMHAQDRQNVFVADGRQNVLDIGPDVLEGLSEEEQQWYKHFQEGILFFDGWVAISEEVLTVFPEQQQKVHQAMMQRIGIKIGTEWAKDNSIRRIDTEMLQKWGDQLRSARAVGPNETLAALEAIELEVDIILQDSARLSQVTRES